MLFLQEQLITSSRRYKSFPNGTHGDLDRHVPQLLEHSQEMK